MKSIALRVRFRVLTPLFLGGASQEAELRIPSIRGALRFWYRAIDPEFEQHEPRLFGSMAGGGAQSAVWLHLESLPDWKPFRWRRENYDRYTVGQGKSAKNGLHYLGFPLAMKGNEQRTAIPPGTEFSLVVTWMDRQDRLTRRHFRGLLGSLWALGHLGGLGSRSRRGFGSVELVSWERHPDCAVNTVPDAWLEDLTALPLLGTLASRAEWTGQVGEALGVFDEWFEPWPTAPPKSGGDAQWSHPHLGPKARIRMTTAWWNTWEVACNEGGRALQDFRVRKQPDYNLVKSQVQYAMGDKTGNPIRQSPARAVFGMPLVFRFSSLSKDAPRAEFVPFWERLNLDRHASPLLMRLVRLKDGFHVAFVRMDGPMPGQFPPATLHRSHRALAPWAGSNLLDDFLNTVK